MTKVGSYQAKTHLPALLKRVEAGERFTITRHGVPVARLVPVSDGDAPDPGVIVDELLAFRSGRVLGPGLSVRSLIDEGRR